MKLQLLIVFMKCQSSSCKTETVLFPSHCCACYRCGPFLWQHWRHDWVSSVPYAEVLLAVHHAAHLRGESSLLYHISLIWFICFVPLFCLSHWISALMPISSHLFIHIHCFIPVTNSDNQFLVALLHADYICQVQIRLLGKWTNCQWTHGLYIWQIDISIMTSFIGF